MGQRRVALNIGLGGFAPGFVSRPVAGALACALVFVVSRHGAALLELLARGGPPSEEPRAPVAMWVADRDTQALWGLDAVLCVQTRVALSSWPTHAVSDAAGGAWVACAERGPGGSYRWLHVDADGRAQRGPARSFEAIRSVVADGQGGVLLWSGVDRVALWAIDARGAAARLLSADSEHGFEHGFEPGAMATDGEARILVGSASGALELFDRDGRRLASRSSLLDGDPAAAGSPTAAVVDVARRGSCGWWALTEEGRLVALDDELRVRWTRDTPLETPRLALPAACRAALCDPAPESPCDNVVWVGGRKHALAYDCEGALRAASGELPVVDLEQRGIAWQGGALFASQGALVRLDERGALAPGQGGFEYVVALAPGLSVERGGRRPAVPP